MNQQEIDDGKTIAVISYITIAGVLIAYFMNTEKRNNFAYFHIRQALGLWLTFFAIGLVVSNFDSWSITLGFYAFFGVLFLYGLIMALTGKATAVPLVGEFYQKFLSGIGKS